MAFTVMTFAHSTESVTAVPGVRVPGNFTIPAPAGPRHTFGGLLGGGSAHDREVPAS
ncbi:hypothetical protein [Jatrophihabitans lederbergiae]|uniref:Uncharacterized protein n=1 Tax=Jatrophihabitans lederbergiae TaxID=3075547 RepID=A0ABU2JGV8_9ACTN|nr:hypothetical protein [Jatrophihabitans sp. DSM 44399]MDT0264213.1 hypothetical protein [Jatrophihabitans sp. DSM 44399]